jgi:hypothetical protein
MSAAIRASTLILLAVFTSSCSAKFQYNLSDKVNAEIKPLHLRVEVTQLQDDRGQDNYYPWFVGGKYGLFPLIPYGKIHYDRPKSRFINISTFDFNPTEDFAAAIWRELEQNHYFDSVDFVLGTSGRNADLILNGSITKTTYEATAYYYCLGPLAGVPYILGLPMASVTNVLEMKLVLKRVSDNIVVWSYEAQGEWHAIVGLYYNTRSELNGFPLLLQKELHRGMEQLYSFLKTNDANYWKDKVTIQPK